jgi:hypothetical protein
MTARAFIRRREHVEQDLLRGFQILRRHLGGNSDAACTILKIGETPQHSFDFFALMGSHVPFQVSFGR